jgi:prevent-host-death family protein
MLTIDIEKAKTQLSKLVKAVETGDQSEFIITRNGRPAVRLVPLDQPVAEHDSQAPEMSEPEA